MTKNSSADGLRVKPASSPLKAKEVLDMNKFSKVARQVIPSAHDIKVVWGDGHTSIFHHMWLRDTCQCAACHHPSTTERMLDTSTLSLDLGRADLKVQADALEITWRENFGAHRSLYSFDWLRENCYTPAQHPATAADLPPPREREEETLWTARDMNALGLPRLSYEEFCAGDDSGLLSFLQLTHRYGFCLLSGVPPGPDMATRVATRISVLKNTFWGSHWSVASTPNPKNLSLTGAALQPHTDFSWSESPPGLQLLGCRVFKGPAGCGGESTLVDGYAAAAVLRQTEPAVYRLLTEVPLGFFFRAEDVRFFHEGPVIMTDAWHARATGNTFGGGGEAAEQRAEESSGTGAAAATAAGAADPFGQNFGSGCGIGSGNSGNLWSRGNVRGIRFNQANRAPLRVRPELVLPMYHAVQTFADLVRSPEMLLKFRLQEGELLMFNNRRLLHGREAYDPQRVERQLEGCYLDAEHFDSKLTVLRLQQQRGRAGPGAGGAVLL